jgi:type I restriction enzyme S subunit
MIKKNELPEGWKIKRFEKVLDFEKKSKHRAGDGQKKGQYKFFTSSNVQNKFIDDFTYTGEHLIFGTGGNPSIHYCNENFSTSADCFVVGLKEPSILLKYVYYYFIANIHLLEEGFRGIGLKHISKAYMQKIYVSYPENIKIQEKIVQILEKTEELKNLRVQAHNWIDEYLKSLFLEMFGDPAINPKNFDVVKLKTLYSKKKAGTKCGPFGSALKKKEYVNSGIPVWTMDNIQDHEFSETGCLHITEEKFRKLEPYSAVKGDIIISRAGTVGKMCIVNSDKKNAIISTNLIRLSLDETKILPIYFVLLMSLFKGRVGDLKTGEDGSYTFMNTTVLNDLEIPLPPTELQKQFAVLIHQIKTVKNLQEESRIQIDNLFNALMQKTFRGELIC